jgi:hypothetical protein
MGNKKSTTEKKVDKKEDKVAVEMKPEEYEFSKADKSKRIIGIEIDEVLKRNGVESDGKTLPNVIQLLMDYTEANINTHQIFKLEGSKVETNVLTYYVDQQKLTKEDLEKYNIHVAVAVLKKYIRELPGGLLPYKNFSILGDITDEEELLTKMKEEVKNTITGSRLYFLYNISRLLNLAMKNKEANSMGLIDLTQVFRMNLMNLEDPKAAIVFTERAKRICDILISKHEELFEKGS